MAMRRTEDFVASLRLEEKESKLVRAIKDAGLDVVSAASFSVANVF